MSLVISDLLGGGELPLLPNPCGLAIPSIVSSDNMRRHLHSQLPKDKRAKRSLLHGLRGGGDLLEEPPQNERRVFEKANLIQSLFAQWLDQATQVRFYFKLVPNRCVKNMVMFAAVSYAVY